MGVGLEANSRVFPSALSASPADANVLPGGYPHPVLGGGEQGLRVMASECASPAHANVTLCTCPRALSERTLRRSVLSAA